MSGPRGQLPIPLQARKRLVGMQTRLQSRIAARDAAIYEVITISDESSSSSDSNSSDSSSSSSSRSSSRRSSESSSSSPHSPVTCSDSILSDSSEDVIMMVYRNEEREMSLSPRKQASISDSQSQESAIVPDFLATSNISNSTPTPSRDHQDANVNVIMNEMPVFHPNYSPTNLLQNNNIDTGGNSTGCFLTGEEVEEFFNRIDHCSSTFNNNLSKSNEPERNNNHNNRSVLPENPGYNPHTAAINPHNHIYICIDASRAAELLAAARNLLNVFEAIFLTP